MFPERLKKTEQDIETLTEECALLREQLANLKGRIESLEVVTKTNDKRTLSLKKQPEMQ